MCRAPKHEQRKDIPQDTSELNSESEALTPGASQPEQEEQGFLRRQVIKGSQWSPIGGKTMSTRVEQNKR